jgi:hypothetical protein
VQAYGRRYGLVGRNGVGKTTFLKFLVRDISVLMCVCMFVCVCVCVCVCVEGTLLPFSRASFPLTTQAAKAIPGVPWYLQVRRALCVCVCEGERLFLCVCMCEGERLFLNACVCISI